MLESRTQDFANLGHDLNGLTVERAQIQEVAIDMWNPYDTVCAELLHAVIPPTEFHVMQAVNRELKQSGISKRR